MKTHELLAEVSIFDEHTLRKTFWKSPEKLTKWLKANGFRRLGGGAYSRV